MTTHDLSVLGTTHAARIEVGVHGCWNARALLEHLTPYRSFLIQLGPEQWVVHVQTPGCHGENTASAVAAIEECLDERGITAAPIRIDGKLCRAAATVGGLA